MMAGRLIKVFWKHLFFDGDGSHALLLGEDISGAAKGVSFALALSNAITNLADEVSGKVPDLLEQHCLLLNHYLLVTLLLGRAFMVFNLLGRRRFLHHNSCPTSISVQMVSCGSAIRNDGVPRGSSSARRREECHQLGRYWPLTTRSPDAHQDQICIIRLWVTGLQIRDHEAHRWNMYLWKSTPHFPEPSSDTYRIKKYGRFIRISTWGKNLSLSHWIWVYCLVVLNLDKNLRMLLEL